MAFVSDIAPLITSQVIAPLLFIWWLVAPPLPEETRVWQSRSNWALHALVATAAVTFALAVGAQSWTSVYVGAGLMVLLFVALVHSARDLPENWSPFHFGDTWQEKLLVGAQILVGVVYIPLSAYAFIGYASEEEAIPLRFLLKGGVHCWAWGKQPADQLPQRQRDAGIRD